MRESLAKPLVFVSAFFIVASTGTAAIMDAAERREKLDTIHALVSNEVQPVEESLLAAARSPFVPSLGHVVEKEIVREEVVLSDEELLTALSEYINPTGIFMFGGEFYLVFKEKKLKVGSEIGITFNGANYSVAVTQITGSTYTVRRGDAEIQLKLK